VETPAKSQPVESLVNTTVAFLKRYPPFDEMDDGALRFMAGHLSLAYYPAGNVVLAPESGLVQHLYIVQRGLVQLRPAEGYHVSDGDVETLGPGECFSVYALMEKRAVGSPYTAAEDTFCYQLPAALFDELLRRSARFQDFSMHYLRSLLQESRRLIKMHSASSASEQQAMSRTLRDLVQRAPVTCQANASLETSLRLIQQARVGSIVITNDAMQPIGIFSRSDVLDRVTLAGRALSEPMSAVMTPNPITLPADATAYDAALVIATRGIRHVPVTDNGTLIGVVTERDLFAMQRVSVRGINRTIEQARDAGALEQAGREIQALARALLAQGVAAEQLTQLITALNDALSRRAIAVIAEQHDLRDIQWCWLAFGSEGRLEQTISTDQDNGLIFAAENEAQASGARARLLPFAAAVNQLLDRCGFPLCMGQIMAGNPRWCMSEDGWRKQFQDWVRNTDPDALLNSMIFFDFRALAGNEHLAARFREFLHDLTRENARFLRQLAQSALETKPPLGLISDFVTEQSAEGENFIDLKKSGARLFVDAARVFALLCGVPHTNTAQRLRQAGNALKMPDDEIAAITDGFLFIQQLRLRTQLAADAREHANRIYPANLHEIDRRILKESLRQARKLQSRLSLDFQL
jgi:CBS domain-containing protein